MYARVTTTQFSPYRLAEAIGKVMPFLTDAPLVEDLEIVIQV